MASVAKRRDELDVILMVLLSRKGDSDVVGVESSTKAIRKQPAAVSSRDCGGQSERGSEGRRTTDATFIARREADSDSPLRLCG